MNKDISKEDKITLRTASSDPASLQEYLRSKANSHTYYKVYSTLERVQSSLEDGLLYLSSGKNWNDRKDREDFNAKENDFVRFGLCLSCSKSENVAMWMLYGGMKQHGVMLDFRQTQIKSLLDCKEIELGYIDESTNGFIQDRVLRRDDFQIGLIDVLYFSNSEDGRGYDIKRADEVCKNIAAHVVDEFNGIKKYYPWNYENECRLVITVKRNAIDSRDTIVRISAGKILKQLNKEGRIILAPNFSGSVPFSKSTMANQIEWNLCTGCRKE